MTIGIILTILAVFELCLAFWFLFKYQRSTTIVSYALFALGSAIYVGSNGIGELTGSYLIGERLGWVGGVVATIFFLPFSLSFPILRKRISDLIPWIVWPLVVFGGGTLLTQLFIKSHSGIYSSFHYEVSSGQYFWVLGTFIGVYWIWSISNLIRAYKTAADSQRRLLRYVIIGTLISLVASIVFDILFSLNRPNNLGYVGSLFNAAWVGITSYILVRPR